MILLVDDDPQNRKLATRVLELAGYVVIACATIEAALAALAERVPDLLLVDLLLTPQNGLDLVRGVRDNPAFARMPILIWTGYADPELRGLAVKEGCQGYIVKAVAGNDDLLAAIRQWVPR